MASINASSSRITALMKFYNTDTTQFYPKAATSDEYPHAFYAVTVHSAHIANQNGASIVRLIQSSGGVWKTYELRDPSNLTEPFAITSSGTAYHTGDLVRLGNNIYYNHYDTNWNLNGIFRARGRFSASDTAANCIFRGGIPDPNAELVINRIDDIGEWTYAAGAGAGSASMDRSPLHKLYGRAGILFTQETNGATSSITFTVNATLYPSGMNIATFSDGTSIAGDDYIAFTCYRWTKLPIADVRIEISSGGFSGFYYWAPVTMTPTSSLRNPEDSSEWNYWDFKQNTVMAEWGNNPYDHQLFQVRIPKNCFMYSTAKGANTGWANIKNVRFTMRGNQGASSSNPAKVTINNLRVLKSPPIPVPYRIQWLACEQEEDGSSVGWQCTAGGITGPTFNHHLAREGNACIEIPQNPGGASCPVLSINFSTPRDFVTFSDGKTAGTSYVVKMDLFTAGFGAANTGLTLASWSRPHIRFISGGEGSNTWADIKFGMGSMLRGGGITRQVPFAPGGGGQWTLGAGGSPTWTAIDRIEIYGQYYAAKTLLSYFMDNLRIERPAAKKPINMFEPVDLLALDAVDFIAGEYLGNNAAAAVDATTDVISWWFRWMKYRTHGYGYAVYPDYEHSSVGISSLRLVTSGTKPFGMTIEVDPSKWPGGVAPASDLSQFWIPSMTTSYQFNWPTQFGFVKYDAIAADDADEFSIWIAAEKPEAVSEIVIKLHGNKGAGQSDPNNFWEYRISGHEIQAKMRDQKNKEKELKELYKQTKKAIQKKRWGDLAMFYLNPDNASMFKEYFGDGIDWLGIDRGGWPSAIIRWRRKDMLLQRHHFEAGLAEGGSSGTPVWSDIRGHTFEVIGTGDKVQVCFDNFFLKSKGALNGSYWYKMLLEDEEGFLSPATGISEKVIVEDQDVQLENLYVPNSTDKQIVPSKRIYRMGGSSSEWRMVKSVDINNTMTYDNVPDTDLGLIAPVDAFQPPQAKVMKAIGNIMYYGNVRTRFNEVLPYRLYRSEPYCPYRVQENDAVDLPEVQGAGITGIAGYYGNVVVWTNDAMYTVDPMLTTPPMFRSHRGCVAKRSVDVSDYGLIWLSKDGLMIGNPSQVNENFFRPINSIFASFTEEQLANAIGFVRGQYYYLFYDPDTTKRGICCYLPEQLFSELTGNAFDVYSVAVCRGATDNDLVYYGRGTAAPGIFQMFSGATDNGTAISTRLRTKDFADPGIVFDKYLSAVYITGASMYSAATSTTAHITVNAYCNQTAVDTMPTIDMPVSTSLKSYVSKAIQGDWGHVLGYAIAGTNRHKITDMALKVEPEADVEYHV